MPPPVEGFEAGLVELCWRPVAGLLMGLVLSFAVVFFDVFLAIPSVSVAHNPSPSSCTTRPIQQTRPIMSKSRVSEKPPPIWRGLMFSGPAKAASVYGRPHKVENDGLDQPDIRRALLSQGGGS